MPSALERRLDKLEADASATPQRADDDLHELWDVDSAARYYGELLPKGDNLTAEERREVTMLKAARRAWGLVHYRREDPPALPGACNMVVAEWEAKVAGHRFSYLPHIAEEKRRIAEKIDAEIAAAMRARAAPGPRFEPGESDTLH
jgi:hypothetical protein